MHSPIEPLKRSPNGIEYCVSDMRYADGCGDRYAVQGVSDNRMLAL